MSVLIAVVRDKHVHGVDLDESTHGAPATFFVLELNAALAHHYPTDAHLTSYVLTRSGRPSRRQPRVNKGGLDHMREQGFEVTSSVMFSDIDNEDHGEWTTELRAAFDEQWATLPVLKTCGCYLTSHGHRLIQPLPEPISVTEIERYLVAWHLELEAAGIAVDRSCRDWTRLYRLPHVARDGTEYVSPLVDLSRVQPREIEPVAAGYIAPAVPNGAAPDLEATTFPLGAAFAAAGMLGRRLRAGKWAVQCPNEAEHSTGKTYDGSTIIYAPNPTRGQYRGCFHCAHAHCQDLK